MSRRSRYPPGGFELGGWSFGYFDDVLGQRIGEAMAKPFDLVLGRKTYEIFAAHWPFDEGPIADRMNAATKHVASRTLGSVDWAGSKLIEGDVATAVRNLKVEDGPRAAAGQLIDVDERRDRRDLRAGGRDPEGLVRVRGAHRRGGPAARVARRVLRRRPGGPLRRRPRRVRARRAGGEAINGSGLEAVTPQLRFVYEAG